MSILSFIVLYLIYNFIPKIYKNPKEFLIEVCIFLTVIDVFPFNLLKDTINKSFGEEIC